MTEKECKALLRVIGVEFYISMWAHTLSGVPTIALTAYVTNSFETTYYGPSPLCRMFYPAGDVDYEEFFSKGRELMVKWGQL